MNILDEIRAELRKNVDRKYREGSVNFFKEKIRCYGVRTPITRKIANKYFQKIKHLNKREIFQLCEGLLETNHNEEATIAFSWCYKIKDKFEKSDFKIFKRWIDNYLTNWGMIDDFCTHSVGHLIYTNPEFVGDLKKWTKSKNRWMRRASAVTLIYCVNRKRFLKESFEISSLLLTDEDDLVRKGYGWLLKVASDSYQKEVFNYVMKNKSRMPRVSLRYAVEKMPKSLKIKAMS
jgi:3-methyladenine DNA glycosylase AlkD